MASKVFSVLRSASRLSGTNATRRSFMSTFRSGRGQSVNLSPLLLGSLTAVAAASGATYFANKCEGNLFQTVSASAYVPPKMPDAKATKTDRTFIMIKPDGVQRGLIADIIKRFEQRGYKLVAMKFMQASEEHLKTHYADLSGKPFFAGLIKYVGSGPVVAMVWEGLDIVKSGRMMLGETNPLESKPGSIRGDYSVQVGRNIIHGSDTNENAAKEIKLWFSEKELVDWKPLLASQIYED